MNNLSEIIHLTLFTVTDRKIITGEANPLSGQTKHTIVVRHSSTPISGPHQLMARHQLLTYMGPALEIKGYRVLSLFDKFCITSCQ